MEIDINEITSGKWDSEKVWICDYRHNDITEKPIRHVQPQQVLVRCNSETTKKIYYSKSHFVKINKKGEPLKTVIPVFDNTGYRSLSGTPLKAFTTEKECKEQYKKFCEVVERQYIGYRDSVIEEVDIRLQILQEIKNDYSKN